MTTPGASPAPEPGAAPAPARSALAVLTSRQFGPYFVGNLTSSVGTWFQNLAAAILVFRLTGSTLLVGVVNFAQFAGAVVLAPWAGAAADRFDRRRLLVVTQLVAFAVTAALAVLTRSDRVDAVTVIAAAALLGLSLAFMVPALLSLVPLLVPIQDLDTAVSLNSVTFNLARAVGPVLAAVVIDRYGLWQAFAVNAVSFLALVAALLLVRPRAQARAPGARPRFRDSLRLVRGDEVLVALMVVVMAVSTTTDPVNTLTPEFATRVLGRSDTVTGVLIGGFGAGATTTAVVLLGWVRRRRHALVGAMVVEGAGMVLFALAPNLVVAVAGMAVAGGGFLAAITLATARIQREVADDQLGRVMALWSLAFIGTRPIAALVDGVLADGLGVRTAGVLMALPALVTAAWVHRRIRRRRAGQAAAGGTSVAT